MAWCKTDTSFDFESMNLSERAVLQSSDSLVFWKDIFQLKYSDTGLKPSQHLTDDQPLE